MSDGGIPVAFIVPLKRQIINDKSNWIPIKNMSSFARKCQIQIH